MKPPTFLIGCLASIVLADVAANLTKSKKEFEAAESRAAQNYESSEKGALSGQIFVATKGGESVRFGAVQISLFARDAIDVLLAGFRAVAEAKIEQLRLDVATAEGAEKQASAAEAQAGVAKAQAEATLKRNRELYEKGFTTAGGAGAVTTAKADVNAANEALNAARQATNTARRQIESACWLQH